MVLGQGNTAKLSSVKSGTAAAPPPKKKNSLLGIVKLL